MNEYLSKLEKKSKEIKVGDYIAHIVVGFNNPRANVFKVNYYLISDINDKHIRADYYCDNKDNKKPKNNVYYFQDLILYYDLLFTKNKEEKIYTIKKLFGNH